MTPSTTNEKAMEKFRSDTSEAMRKCAVYLIEHADELAEQFAGGCTGWSIEFRAGDEMGAMPWVEVHTSCDKVDVIGAYRSKDTETSYRALNVRFGQRVD